MPLPRKVPGVNVMFTNNRLVICGNIWTRPELAHMILFPIDSATSAADLANVVITSKLGVTSVLGTVDLDFLILLLLA
ncbi:unnamed protein product, partial [Iphiclides podalirius]